MSEREVSEYFDTTTDEYKADMDVSDIDHWDPVDNYVRLLSEQGDVALDIGCGEGLFIDYCLSHTAISSAVGLDLSAEMLPENRTDGRSHYVVGTARVLPFRAGSFDFVFIGDVLHHVVGNTRSESKEHAVSVLRRCLSLLSEDGRLIVKDIAYESPVPPRSLSSHLIFTGLKYLHPIAALLDESAHEGLRVCFFTQDELIDMVERAGGTVEKIELLPEELETPIRQLLVGKRACIRIYVRNSDENE